MRAAFHFSPRPNRANEIEWRIWGEEAFAEAKRRDVPVLLAISAVWCHWCHVMDETSYSTGEIIEQINQGFVPIRVDNDERPDVNRRYNMGGWPTTVFLTPSGEILHGATYIAPEQMYQTCLAVAEVWREKREDIEGRIAEAVRKETVARPPQMGELTHEIVSLVRALVSGQYDPQYGGFGRDQKFPQPKVLRFLMDEHRRAEAPELATMLRMTLDGMSKHGMYDHVEGGFFRYATRRDWNVPHYEKMLEDNAELLAIYADAHRLFPDAGYDGVVRDVIRWMDAVLYQPDVGLWSGSQDADEHYYHLDADARRGHDAPFVDRRLYTSWNALTAIAYIRAGEVLDDRELRERGADATKTIGRRMRDATGALCRYDDGSGPRLPDLLEDAATYLRLLLAIGDIDGATAHAKRMRAQLDDTGRGGFFDAPARSEPGRLARRERPLEENALAADALLTLAALAQDDEWRDVAVRGLRSFAGEYRQWGQFAAPFANAVARALREPVSITVVGRKGDAAATALWRASGLTADPDAVRLHLDPALDRNALAERGFPPDRVAAYVCVGTSCSAPLTDEGSLRRELAAARERSVAARV